MSDPTTPVTPAPAPATDTTTLVTTVSQAMSKVMADFNAAKAKGPITLSGAVALLEELVSAGMLAVKPFLSPGADVAGLISTILMEVYTKEIRPLELQHFGAIVSTAVIDPLIHQSIPLLVAAAQKALLHI